MTKETMWAQMAEDRLDHNYQEAVNTLIAAGLSDKEAEKAAYHALCQLHFRLMRQRIKQGEEGRI